MKKILRGFFIFLVVVIAAVLVAAHFFMGNIVKTGVEKVGPQVVGVPMSLDKAQVWLVKGDVELTDLVIGNPKGFKSKHAFKLGTLNIDMEPKSVFADDIVINEIVIDSPEIVYELSLKGSNLGAIIDGLKNGAHPPERKGEPGTAATGAGAQKKVQVTDLYVRNAKVTVTSTLLQGKGATLALSEIHLKNLGKDTGGISLAGATEILLCSVLKTVVVAVKGSGTLATDLAGAGLNIAGDLASAGLDAAERIGSAGLEAGKAVLDGGADAVKALGKGAGKAVESVGNVAGKSIDAVSGAAEKGVEAVGSGAKAVGSAAKEGAGKVLKGVGGLFGKGEGDKKKDE